MDKIIGGILALIAVYVLFIANDGALFMEITDRLGVWFADRLTQDTPW